MFFQIPKNFKDVKIFAISARVWCKNEWTQSSIRKAVKNSEFRDFYYGLRSDFEISTLLELLSKYNIELIIDESGKIEKYGRGDQVFLRISNKAFLYLSSESFYYKPRGVSFQCTYFSDVLRSLKNSKNSSKSDSKLRKNLKMNNSKNIQDSTNKKMPVKESSDNIATSGTIETHALSNIGFMILENIYKISIEIWSKKSSKSFHYSYDKLRIGSFKFEKLVELHYSFETEKFYVIEDSEIYFKQYFPCKNRLQGCMYYFNTMKELQKHEKNVQILKRTKLNKLNMVQSRIY